MPKVKPEAEEEPKPLFPALQKFRLFARPTQLANHPHSEWESLSMGFPTCKSHERKQTNETRGPLERNRQELALEYSKVILKPRACW